MRTKRKPPSEKSKTFLLYAIYNKKTKDITYVSLDKNTTIYEYTSQLLSDEDFAVISVALDIK